MAKRIRLTDDDILDLFDSSGDEMDVDQSDEDVDFDPKTTENGSDTSSLHELPSSRDEDMDVSGVGDADTSAGRMSDDAKGDVASDGHDVGLNANATNNGSVWRPYLPTDSDLLKLLFTVSNPGIRLPTSGQYNNELSFFQLFFTDDIIGEIVQETNRYAREKIEKAQPLGKRSIWRTWKDANLQEMKALLGVVLNM